ncbi:helix-turn-helix domain-containing protein [Nocardia sp. R7R-8]|uniref:helix-turn-helix domain-containing protein n=1 Tax=Nocardia sp. R7R-8 TaxID=3459304 RepID=UPI00403DAD76
MGRPERPLDPNGGPVASFAQSLRELRQQAGNPKYLQMARMTGRSRTALSEAAGGERLPSWETTEAFVKACDGSDYELSARRRAWEHARDSLTNGLSTEYNQSLAVDGKPALASKTPTAHKNVRILEPLFVPSLDPNSGPVASFAQSLRELRQQAGNPKYLQMARMTGRSRTALSEAAGGEHFPSWETTEAFVKACGGDLSDWRRAWEQTRESLKEGPSVEYNQPLATNINSQFASETLHRYQDRSQLLEQFASQLREVRLHAGEPPLRKLERLDSRLKRATVANVLNGKTAPTLDFVVWFIGACTTIAQQRDLSLADEHHDLELWRQRWIDQQRQLSEHRRRSSSRTISWRSGA